MIKCPSNGTEVLCLKTGGAVMWPAKGTEVPFRENRMWIARAAEVARMVCGPLKVLRL